MIKQFGKYLTGLNLKMSTIKKHTYAINRLDNETGMDCKRLRRYFDKLKGGGCSPAYLTNLACTVRRYGGLIKDKKLKKFPLYGKKSTYVRATLSEAEIKDFLNIQPVKNEDRWGSRRYKMFWQIIAFTGMRTGEAARLKIEDIDLDRRLFVLRDTKTNTPRIVPIPDFLLNELTGYIKQLKNNWLFPGKQNMTKPIDNVDWHYDFHKRIKKIGIVRKNLCPYSLRHSFISNNIGKNCNLFLLQQIVGHKDNKTTAGYTHLTVENLRPIINKGGYDVDDRMVHLEQKMDQIINLLTRR